MHHRRSRHSRSTPFFMTMCMIIMISQNEIQHNHSSDKKSPDPKFYKLAWYLYQCCTIMTVFIVLINNHNNVLFTWPDALILKYTLTLEESACNSWSDHLWFWLMPSIEYRINAMKTIIISLQQYKCVCNSIGSNFSWRGRGIWTTPTIPASH